MNVELLSTGDELLTGQVVDTNSGWLMDKLWDLGLMVRRKTLVGDDRADLLAALREIGARADFLVMGGGLALVRELADAGKRTFLDMKLLDIENTVERATRNAAAAGAAFLTVHAQDAKTLKAALAGRAGTGLKVLGVTVLTNLDAADLGQQGIAAAPADLVARRAALALA